MNTEKCLKLNNNIDACVQGLSRLILSYPEMVLGPFQAAYCDPTGPIPLGSRKVAVQGPNQAATRARCMVLTLVRLG